MKDAIKDERIWKTAAIALACVVFGVGLFTLVQKIGSVIPQLPASNHGKVGAATVISSDITKANFAYLVPGKDDAWKFDDKTTAFVKAQGVAKYTVALKYAGISVTVSQQKMPDALKPRGGAKFMSFIINNNVNRTQDAGLGTVYFMPAVQNGAAANGADTVMFATDDVLMFCKAGSVLGYDAWAKMLATMKPH